MDDSITHGMPVVRDHERTPQAPLRLPLQRPGFDLGPFEPGLPADEQPDFRERLRKAPTAAQRVAIVRPEERLLPANELTFPPQLAFECALDMEQDLELLFRKYGLDGHEARTLARSPAFQLKVREYKTEIVNTGYSFRLKAKLQAEDLLSTSYHLAQDPDTPASVRADLIQWTARMADLEPAKKEAKTGGGGSPFQLNISFHGAAGAVSVGGTDGGTALIEDAEVVE